MLIYLAIALVILGLTFFVIELFVPGFGVFGISGILMIFASIGIIMLVVPNGLIIILGLLIFIFFFLYCLWQIAKRLQLSGKIILHDTLAQDKKDVGGLDYFLGKEGISKTPLKPFGSANFNGVVIDVYSDGDYIQEKEKIKVINVLNDRLIVKRIEPLNKN